MTAPTTSTAVAKPDAAPARQLSPEAAAAKARREIVQQIKGTQWGKDCSPEVAYAVARWSLDNGVDAVRHVEVLGGKPYLNGDFYLEKAAPFVMSGELRYDEPRFVHADPGLILMANRKLEEVPEWEQPQVEWAREELFRRFQARVDRGIPHDATGACIFTVHTKSGTPLPGVNWCGGESKVKNGKNGKYRGDPIGDAEPTKTAQTRAARRALRQIIEAFPDSPLARSVGKIEASAKALVAEVSAIAKAEADALPSPHPVNLLSVGETSYEVGAVPEPVEAPAPIDEATRLAAVARDARMVALEEREDRGEAMTAEDLEDLRQWRMDNDR